MKKLTVHIVPYNYTIYNTVDFAHNIADNIMDDFINQYTPLVNPANNPQNGQMFHISVYMPSYVACLEFASYLMTKRYDIDIEIYRTNGEPNYNGIVIIRYQK